MVNPFLRHRGELFAIQIVGETCMQYCVFYMNIRNLDDILSPTSWFGPITIQLILSIFTGDESACTVSFSFQFQPPGDVRLFKGKRLQSEIFSDVRYVNCSRNLHVLVCGQTFLLRKL